MLICHGAVRAEDAGLIAELAGELRPAPGAERLVAVEAGAIAGLASLYPDDAAPDRDVESLALAHNDLLCRFAARGDVAPLRLDRVYADDAELRAALSGDSERLGRLLDGVAGRLEFSARLSVAPSALPPARNGRDFLRARGALRGASAREARTAFVRAMAENFAACCDAVRALPRPAAGAPQPALARLALLASREAERLAALEAEAARLMAQAESLGLRLEVSGPWAPYVFTAEEEHHAGAA